MRAKMISYISVIVCLCMITACFLPFCSFADEADNTDAKATVEKLITGEDFLPSNEVSREVWDSIAAKTGVDDLYKTYMYVGDCLTSYTSDTQYFTNGSYEQGIFICDQDKLAEWINTALTVYNEKKNLLSFDELHRARSIISYGYEKLSVIGRMKVGTSPEWLVGRCYDGYRPLYYADEMDIYGFSGTEPAVFTDAIRKIVSGSSGFSKGIFFNAVTASSFEIAASSDSERFMAVLGSDVSALETDYKNAYVTVSLVYSNGKVKEQGSYGIYKGYENRIEIELEGADSIRFDVFCTTEADTVTCLLADPVFLSADGNDYSDTRLGESGRDKFADVNRDGIVSTLDVEMLKYAVTGNPSFDAELCDLSKNGILDYYDVICLENYLIYLENRNNEYRKPDFSLKVTALGDSIAQGSGLAGAENGECSTLAYNNLVADMLENVIGYDAEFVNYGHSGDKISDLLATLKSSSVVRGSVSESDLILVSIGGNDFLQTLMSVMVLMGGAEDLADLADMTSVKDGKVVLDSDMQGFVELAANSCREGVVQMLEELRMLNPKAQIVVTEIPNSTPSSAVYVEIDGELGSYDRELWDLHAFTDSIMAPYNGIIQQICASYEGVTCVEMTEVFDGSAELSLSIVSDRVCINDLLAGDYSAFEHFDVHPSDQGHLVMANAHINALNKTSVLDEWINDYKEAPTLQSKYKYSETFGKEEIGLDARIYSNDDSRIVYKVTVSDADKLENLLGTVSFDSSKLSLVSLDLEGIDKVIHTADGGLIKFVADKDKITGKNAVITVTFERLNTGSETGEFTFTACESRLTYNGEWKAQSSHSEKVDLDKVDNETDIPGDVDTDTARIVVYSVFAVVFAVVILSVGAALVAHGRKKTQKQSKN